MLKLEELEDSSKAWTGRIHIKTIVTSNYLGKEEQALFGEIDLTFEKGIRTSQVTAAEVAEHLLRSDDLGTLRVKNMENQEARGHYESTTRKG
ncbi:hypothetical protein V6N13_112380 [Hibiscus sabdariffa]